MSLLTKEKIYRGSDPVDLLIGIDHAQMHTGETRQSEHLGGQEFTAWMGGIWATTSKNQETSRIFLVSYTVPVICQNFGPQNPWSSK